MKSEREQGSGRERERERKSDGGRGGGGGMIGRDRRVVVLVWYSIKQRASGDGCAARHGMAWHGMA